jgi:hypothetical protein
MSYVETLSPQTAFVVNAIALRSTELDHFSVVIPSDDDPVSRVIKATTSMWKSCARDEIKSLQSDKTKILTVTPDAARFREFVSQWRKERNSLSSSAWDNVRSPAYQRIIGMGERALPFILNEMQREMMTGDPDDWFIALWSITGENPVPLESRGHLKEMASAWIQWGLQLGHINGEGLGAAFSTIGYLRRP